MNKARHAQHTERTVRGLLPVLPPRGRRGVVAQGGEPSSALSELIVRNRALEEQVAALQKERAELHQALFEGAQVQRKLRAARELRRGRFEIASEVFPVRYISGDFYDVLRLGTHTGLFVGDIAGKGLSAGLWLTHVVGLIRIHAAAQSEPSAALAAVNRDLCRLQPELPLASLFFARLNPRTGELLYSNAGQPPAQLLRNDGTVQELQEGGPPLGALPEASFPCGRIVIEPGETLIAYSDGIIECRNAREEEFGLARMLAAARSSNGASASAMLFSILGAVQDFAARCPRHDDFTLMVARHMGGMPRR